MTHCIVMIFRIYCLIFYHNEISLNKKSSDKCLFDINYGLHRLNFAVGYKILDLTK